MAQDDEMEMLETARRLGARVRAWVRSGTLDDDFEDELRSHLSMAAEENERRGMSTDEACRAAHVRLGALASLKQQHREARGLPGLEATIRDLRFAVRLLVKDRWVTAIAIAILSLGIGASTAIFTLMNAVLFRMLPVSEPDRLVQVNRTGPGGAGPWVSFPTYQQLRESAAFDDMLATSGASLWSVAIGSHPSERASVELASPNYFSVLRLRPALGTLTLGPATAVISHGYWMGRFGGEPHVVGTLVSVNGASITITGVAPKQFAGVRAGASTDIWLPVVMQPHVTGTQDVLGQPGHNWLRVLGRLEATASVTHAREGANAVFQNSLTGRAAGLAGPGRESLLAERIELAQGAFGLSTLRAVYSLPLQVLLAASGLALLITCANLAHLFLVRAARRRKEMAIRLAIGASKRHVIRQLLTETLLLSVIGGGLGIVFARWGSHALAGLAVGGMTTDALPLDVDWRVAIFTTAIALTTGVLFGLAPAVQAARISLTEATKDGNAWRRSRFSRMLAISQVAMALTLASGAGLFARSLWNLRAFDPGFDQSHIVLARVDTRALKERHAAADVLEQLRRRLEASPGVRSTALSSRAFFSGGEAQRSIAVRGYVPPPGADLNPFVIAASDVFFETMGVRLITGRSFAIDDATSASTRVAIVNESFARYYFGAGTPIGRTFGFGDATTSGSVEIVGLVADTKDGDIRERARHIVYVPLVKNNVPAEATLAVRATGTPEMVMASVKTAIQEIGRGASLVSLRTMREQIDRSLNRERLLAILSGGLGIVALLLACLGIYAVLACGVRNRAKEFAVRMAIGARASDVVHLIARDTAGILAIGISVGGLASIVAGYFARGLLFGVSPYDLTTFLTATVATLTTGMLAALAPARSAAAADPATILRSE